MNYRFFFVALCLFIGAASFSYAQTDNSDDVWVNLSGTVVGTPSTFAGNVNVGTNSPNSDVSLQVLTKRNAPLLITQTASGEESSILFKDANDERARLTNFPSDYNGTNFVNSVTLAGSHGKSIRFATAPVNDNTHGTVRMIIANNGNVGIAKDPSTNGTTKLSVGGHAEFTSYITTLNGTNASGKAHIIFGGGEAATAAEKRMSIVLAGDETGGNTGSDFRLVAYNDDGSFNNTFLNYRRADQKLRLSNNVGINTFPSDNVPLQVKGHSNVDTANHFIITDQYNNKDFVVNGLGQVLIGFENPGLNNANVKLLVDGGIIAEKVKVQLADSWSWPDYVFADEYKKRDLEEVEAFIKDNKHLPGIPSAAEVAEEGIDLGQMNAKLLEKIEELTLYMIEQNKLMKEQNERIRELENKLAEQE